jgi:thioredoxin-related protein
MQNNIWCAIVVWMAFSVVGCARQDSPMRQTDRVAPSVTPQTSSDASQVASDSDEHATADKTATPVNHEPKAAAYDQREDRSLQQVHWAVVYDDQDDARATLATAVKKANHDQKHVLIMFGTNGCNWCFKLHDVFTKDKEVVPIIEQNYIVVHVSVATEDNEAILKDYGIEDIGSEGIPFLTILDGHGKLVKNQATGPLELGRHYEISRLVAFLRKWAPGSHDKDGT